MRPRDIHCFNDAAEKLRRDNYSRPDFGIMTDGNTVWLQKQTSGKPSEADIEIPKKEFDRLVDWYFRNQGAR